MIPNYARDTQGKIKKGVFWKPKRLCLICGKDGVRIGRKYCSQKCFGLSEKGKLTWMMGKKHSKKSLKKLSQSHLGQKAWNKNKKCPQFAGENHWNWQNGKTKIGVQIRRTLEYREWKNKVFQRDNWTCQFCGKRGNGELHADHIYPLSKIIKEYHITHILDAYKCKIIWDISNGRTLCFKCHKKNETYPKNLRYAIVRTYEK